MKKMTKKMTKLKIKLKTKLRQKDKKKTILRWKKMKTLYSESSLIAISGPSDVSPALAQF